MIRQLTGLRYLDRHFSTCACRTTLSAMHCLPHRHLRRAYITIYKFGLIAQIERCAKSRYAPVNELSGRVFWIKLSRHLDCRCNKLRDLDVFVTLLPLADVDGLGLVGLSGER